MPRTRLIKPAFFINEQLADLPFEYRLLFVGLWTEADREGRLLRRPKRLKASLFPYDNVDIEAGLQALAQAGLVLAYTHEGEHYLVVPGFRRHQNPHMKEPASTCPPPPGAAPDESSASTRPAPGQHQASTRPAPGKTSARTVLAPDEHQTSPADTDTDTDTDTDADTDADAVATAPAPPPVLTFPCQGSPARWLLTTAQVEAWAQLYPDLDILAECKHALAYVEANGRKTALGMPRYLVTWFNRSVRMGATRRAPVPVAKPDSWDSWRPTEEVRS